MAGRTAEQRMNPATASHATQPTIETPQSWVVAPVALISSGSYIAGAVWPTIFERAIAAYGWKISMLAYAAFAVAVIVPLAAFFFRAPPESIGPARGTIVLHKASVLGLRPNTMFAM